MNQHIFRTMILGLFAASCGIGCGGNGGPPLGYVTGTVTLNSEPAAGVRITFVPADRGSPSYGATDENGNYHLLFTQSKRGAIIGKHHVLIETPDLGTDEDGKQLVDEFATKVPRKYQQPGILVAEVESGRNELDFELDGME